MRRYRRLEMLTGPGRRRKWSDDDKAKVVAETLEPGAVVAEVARRWQICPQQVDTSKNPGTDAGRSDSLLLVTRVAADGGTARVL